MKIIYKLRNIKYKKNIERITFFSSIDFYDPDHEDLLKLYSYYFNKFRHNYIFEMGKKDFYDTVSALKNLKLDDENYYNEIYIYFTFLNSIKNSIIFKKENIKNFKNKGIVKKLQKYFEKIEKNRIKRISKIDLEIDDNDIPF